ncbi:MAG: homoserine dehydrogenase [Chloroflexi bacterium]|nr:homoserine dehydrogenase [Chloroflexota bacterium]
MQFNVALLGFGNVGRALAELIMRKRDTLRETYDLDVRVVGISTGRHGKVIDEDGLDLAAALETWRAGGSLAEMGQGRAVETNEQFIAECPADLVFETIPTNPESGQPALDYARAILSRGIHYVTANKGPVAFGYRELRALAAQNDVGFFFESTVMDGGPVLSVGREGLPTLQVNRIRGIFNSTTNYILTRMEEDGLTFDEALRKAQEIGIAETDPTLDIDGWDAAIKTVIVANVIMGADLRPADVNREGIRGLALEEVRAAEADGQRIRLMCMAERTDTGEVRATVRPERVPIGSVLAGSKGTTGIVEFETDVLPRLTILEHDPGPPTTAYGMLADMINLARGRHRDGVVLR